MGLLTLPLALAISALTLPPPDEARKPPAAPPRVLSTADAEWVTKKYAEAVKFGRAGKWGYDEAQGPVREIVARCTRVLGDDHFTTADYRREIEILKQLAALPEAGRLEYMKAYTLYDEMNELWKRERYADALRPAEQLMDIHRRLLGPESAYVALAAYQCGQFLYHAGRYAEAEKQLREALRVYRRIVGEGHPVMADVHSYLALDLDGLGRSAEARRWYEAALDLNIRLRGEGHALTAVVRGNLAGWLDRQALYSDSERHYRKAVETLQAAGDEASSLLATAHSNLALSLQHQGKYAEAEEHYQKALEIRRRLGKGGAALGRLYMNLATNREAQGDVAQAELLLRLALDAYHKEYGPNHVETAWALNNLAVNLDKQAKYAEAEELLRTALAIVQRAPGDQSLAVAKMFNNLASCLRSQEKYADAVALCEKALATVRSRLEADHPDVAATLNNLAAALEDQDRHADAERHFRETLEIMKRRPGEEHPDTALGHVNLGINLYHQGRFDEAERLFQEALATQRRVLGEGHPSTAWTYKNLVLNRCARGDHARAAELAEAAGGSFETARRRISFAGLDRAAPTAEYSPFPALATVAARGGKRDAAWQALEQNLARGLLDDLAARPLSPGDRRREQELLGRLDVLDRQVAALLAGGGKDAGSRTVDELRRHREAAQTEFVRFQADLASRYGVAAGQVYDLPRIQAKLPEDAALLAWVDLPDQARWADPKGDHWACLLRHRGVPRWVRLAGTGAQGAWTDEDDRLAARARRAFATRPTDAAAGGWKDLARRLARQRLEPLQEHLKAQADLPAVRHLIVLPCPRMSAVPVEALTDNLRVSYAPSGTMFAWLQERRAGRGARAPSLLALGDPAFQPARDGGPPGKADSPRPGGRREAFTPLPGTNVELLGIARTFTTKRLLTGSDASEQELDDLAASGRLREYRYLHFATHGVLDHQRPMRSALILAQDRLPGPLAPVGTGKEVYDGRLTAERILRRWKLDAELVTLSACATGLGRFSGGEGHLGFSQALFLAGARSLVLSLWEVDDASTALLMTRFYENLVGAGAVKPMSRAEALAEAKRWLRDLRPEEVNQLTKDLPTRGTRGRVEPRKGNEDTRAFRNYQHPYYWSGFILIGDPG
jgi:CHAT domain-containing protein/tetratricopeptide (TPR) repeat protein